jgi:hypothetical protein
VLRTLSSRTFAARTFIPLRGLTTFPVSVPVFLAGGLPKKERRKSGYARFTGYELAAFVAPLDAFGGAETALRGVELHVETSHSARPTAAGSIRLRSVAAFAQAGAMLATGGAAIELQGAEASCELQDDWSPTAGGIPLTARSNSFGFGTVCTLRPTGIRNPTDEELLLLLRKARKRA